MIFHRIVSWFRRDRFLALLVVVVATLMLLPTIDLPGFQKFLGQTVLALVFAVGAIANRRRRVVFALAVAIAVSAVILSVGTFVFCLEYLEIPRLIVSTLFFGFTAVMILVAVIRDHMATQQAVFGAICAYLLIGLGWAHNYLLIEQIEPNAFFYVERQLGARTVGDSATTSTGQMIYYSFVTLTTLGFGDITPRGPIAQTATWMQAVTGQLFIAVLIARLVSELPAMRRKDS